MGFSVYLFYQSLRGGLEVSNAMVNLNGAPFCSTQFCFPSLEAVFPGAVRRRAITAGPTMTLRKASVRGGPLAGDCA